MGVKQVEPARLVVRRDGVAPCYVKRVGFRDEAGGRAIAMTWDKSCARVMDRGLAERYARELTTPVRPVEVEVAP